MTPLATPTAVIAPILVAFVTAIATLLSRRHSRIQRGLSVLGGVGYALAVAALVIGLSHAPETVLVYQVGDWPAPFGITLVADALSGFMLALTAAVSLPVVVFSVFFVSRRGGRVSFHALLHFVLVGVSGAFLTGDLFNLFVWFEVMLFASYVLVAFESRAEHTRAALQYVVLNLLASALMLLAIGGLYAATGTLNMADMARRLGTPAEYGIDAAPVLGLAALLFVVFALKAGLVPFHFWVPAAYRAAPAPASAILAGVVKTVGIYAIIRLYFTVFSAASFPDGLGLPGFSGASMLSFFGPILFVLAVASIALGGVGALSRPDLDSVFAFSSISQIGFVVLPLGIGATVPAVRRLAVAAALVYALNHALAKAALFLASGAIQRAVGTVRLGELGGLTRTKPMLSASVFLCGLALVGIPPLSGFFGKLMVFDTAVSASAAGITTAAVGLGFALGGAILTIAYVTRVWNRGFRGAESPTVAAATDPRVLIAVLAVLAGSVLVIGFGFDPILRAAYAAADAALDRGAYVDAVAPGGGP